MRFNLDDIDPLFKFGEVIHATPKNPTPVSPKPKNDWHCATWSDMEHPDFKSFSDEEFTKEYGWDIYGVFRKND